MYTEEDTFNALRRTPIHLVDDEVKELIPQLHKDMHYTSHVCLTSYCSRSRKFADLIESHGWSVQDYIDSFWSIR